MRRRGEVWRCRGDAGEKQGRRREYNYLFFVGVTRHLGHPL